jgi:hypothetical protein
MAEKRIIFTQEQSAGDTAVDGLLAGLVGGLAMAVLMVLSSFLRSAEPLSALSYFDPTESDGWITGIFAHLAVSAIYGLVLALLLRAVGWIRPSLHKRLWLWGGAYGLILWGLASWVLLSSVSSQLIRIPAGEFALAHLLYGVISGFWLERKSYS